MVSNYDDIVQIKGGLRYFLAKGKKNKQGVYDPAQMLEKHADNIPDKTFLLFDGNGKSQFVYK